MISNHMAGITGRIAGVNLSSFLQMIEMEQKTCTINILTPKNMGQIFFLDGVVIDANTRNLKHLDALYDILSWNNIIIEVEKNVSKKQNLIDLPLMHIIMESARHLDEREKEELKTGANPIETAPEKSHIPLQVLTTKAFCLEIGIKLLIDFDHRDISFRSRLVGIEHGKYLLLKAPEPFSIVDQDRFQVERLVIKSLYKGTIYAFRSKLTGIISKPSKLMFIEYPRKIEHHELRSHKRFKCSIVTQTELNQKERGGVIENISMGGCLCTIETFSSDTHLATRILNDTMPLRCRFPGSKKEVSFMGRVRNAKKKADEIAVGLEFIHPGPMDEAHRIINHYIQLIEYSGENV